MRTYIIRRLILLVPTLFLASIIVFLMIRLVPGSAIDIVISRMDSMQATGSGYGARKPLEEMREQVAEMLGLDVPVWVQYGRWLGIAPYPESEAGFKTNEPGFNGLFQGNLGIMLWASVPVTEELGARLPVTIELGLMALITSLLISFPIGIYSGIRQDTVGDYVTRSFAIMCIALPGFWLATMVIVLPARYWGWSPAMLYIPLTHDPAKNLVQFLIPGVIMGMASAGINMRMIRTMMLEVLRQDYIRTAWSKGLKERVVILRHALKNALIPVITIIGLQVPILIGGSVIIEQIFNLPGVGRMLLNAVFDRDYTTLSGVVFVIAIFILIVNLLVDLTYAWLDPRLKYR